MQENNIMDSYFYALDRVIDVIYREEEDLADILYFILSLAAELTGAKGSTIRVLEQGMDAAEAVNAPRIHFEDGTVQAEPGVDEEGLARVEARGVQVVRWDRQNLFFGGVQAVVCDPETGEMSGAGDPRRGGSVAFA